MEPWLLRGMSPLKHAEDSPNPWLCLSFRGPVPWDNANDLSKPHSSILADLCPSLHSAALAQLTPRTTLHLTSKLHVTDGSAGQSL